MAKSHAALVTLHLFIDEVKEIVSELDFRHEVIASILHIGTLQKHLLYSASGFSFKVLAIKLVQVLIDPLGQIVNQRKAPSILDHVLMLAQKLGFEQQEHFLL